MSRAPDFPGAAAGRITPSFTVAVVSDLGRTGYWCGTFASVDLARTYVLEQHRRTQPFMRYEIHAGTPASPGKVIERVARPENDAWVAKNLLGGRQ